jgi:glycosyltransferase involved in cell wall biosynthesis
VAASAPHLRIAFIDSWHQDPSLGSGSAAAISGLARGLAAGGHAVSFLRPESRRPLTDLARLRFNFRLRRRFDPDAYDLIVGFDFDGCCVASAAHPRFVVSLKGVLADEARFERGFTRLRLRALSLFERFNVRRAATVVVTSAYSQAIATSRYGISPDRVRIVPEGIDWRSWAEPESVIPGDASRARPPVVLSVARQYPRKNTRRLLEAMPRVREQVPECVCRIVGGGPELPRLLRLRARLGLESCVELLGEIPAAERVRAEYQAADVFCLPSLQEGFGIAFLEAMASGLPVVASRDGAVPEVVPDGKAGVLIDGRSSDAIAAALIRLLVDRPLRHRLGSRGREVARELDWPRVADRFLREVGPHPVRR